jgi:hypothetical protein
MKVGISGKIAQVEVQHEPKLSLSFRHDIFRIFNSTTFCLHLGIGGVQPKFET